MSSKDEIIEQEKDKVNNSIFEIVEKVTSTNDEKSEFNNELSTSIKILINNVLCTHKEAIKKELGNNKLQQLWRPIIMLSFGFIIFYHYLISHVFHLPFIELPDNFWSLIEIGMGGYVIGRSLEKVANNIPFKKK